MGIPTHLYPEVSVALQGTLDTFALPDVLRLLAATRKTGRLRLTGARGTGSAWVRDGAVAEVVADHAPLALEPVDALFELLRFEEGSFTFEPDVTSDTEGEHDVEPLLEQATALLDEWREIESVVPSLDAWVTLRRTLDSPVTIDADCWTTLVAVGSGATVATIATELGLAELPVSRAVRDLLGLGVADLQPEAPAAALLAPAPAALPVDVPAPAFDAVAPAAAPAPEPDSAAGSTDSLRDSDGGTDNDSDDAPVVPVLDEALPAARPIRARRARGLQSRDEGPFGEPDRFVPLDLPGGLSGSYDSPVEGGEVDDATPGVDDLAAAFPGLANRSAATVDEDEVARQLATLSPRAAEAVRAAAEAATEEEREAALDEAVAVEEQPLNRGLLLKFLSSVKS